MRHPLWILNSTLFILLLAAIFFVIFSREPQPEWESLEPSGTTRQLKRRASEINIRKIYEHDLFGTYQPEPHEQEQGEMVVPFPEPPAPRQLSVPGYPKPTFLEPLKVTLKGIVVVLNDDTKNRAIIADATTKKEELYKVGDTIEDAQLIKIFNKKVIFLRANGQQEVLYLRPKDAQLDPAYTAITNWHDAIQHLTENTYLINPQEFTNKVKTLGQFIDLLSLTTVYQQGTSIGARIGAIESNSLGTELGFKPNDVIVSVNNISLADPQNRFTIYKNIVAMQTNDKIVVQLLRNNNRLELTYIIQDFKVVTHAPSTSEPSAQVQSAQAAPTQQQIDLLGERHKFAPTLRDIREKERQTMFKKGRKKSLTSNFAE